MCMENERTKRTNLVYFTSVTWRAVCSRPILCVNPYITLEYIMTTCYFFTVYCLLGSASESGIHWAIRANTVNGYVVHMVEYLVGLLATCMYYCREE